MNKQKLEKGITLIALVITIIVMLILVAVTINIAVNGGLFDYAGRAAKDTNTKKEAEKDYTTLDANVSTDDLIEKYTSYGTTYTAYEIGDIVTISGENFYVIEDSDETKSTVKLLAALNVETDPNSAKYNKQYASAGAVAFDDEEPYSNVYANSTIKQLVDSYVESLGVTVKEGRLMTKEEIVALGGSVEGYSSSGCPAFINAKSFWLGSPDERFNNQSWAVLGSYNSLNCFSISSSGVGGLRPVIVISKTNIPAQ